MYVRANPVFAEIDPDTGNLTPQTIAAVTTERTKAVILVHQGGVPADVAAVREFCDPREIVVIEDAACAAGSSYRGSPVGAGASIAAWSFHPRKLISTGEGGMLTTNNAEWASRARLLREHAMSVSAAERHRSVLPPPEQYLEVGYNYRMTDLQASIGIVQLGRLDAIVARRRDIVGSYQEALGNIPGLRLLADPAWGRATFSRSGSRFFLSSRSTAKDCWQRSQRLTSPLAGASWPPICNPRTQTTPRSRCP